MASRILLADDSITIQKVVNLTFADEGIEVVAVSNGETAERRLNEINPDLVLADIFMPGKNGYELCEHIKQSPQFQNVPVVLLVGAFEPFDQNEARRVKADAHLTKPFESRNLVETVRKLIKDSGKPVTAPLSQPQDAEELSSQMPVQEAIKPIVPPPVNIDFSAMSNDWQQADNDRGFDPGASMGFNALSQTSPLTIDIANASEAAFSIDAGDQEIPSQEAVNDFDDTLVMGSPFTSDATSEATEPQDINLSIAEPPQASDNTLEAEAEGDNPSDGRAAGIPSAFGHKMQEVIVDFDKSDEPEQHTPDNIVSLDTEATLSSVDETGATAISTVVVEEAAAQPADQQPVVEEQSAEQQAAQEANVSESESAEPEVPVEAVEEESESLSPETLLETDSPLGDVLVDERGQSAVLAESDFDSAPLSDVVTDEALDLAPPALWSSAHSDVVAPQISMSAYESQPVAEASHSAVAVEDMPADEPALESGSSFDVVMAATEDVAWQTAESEADLEPPAETQFVAMDAETVKLDEHQVESAPAETGFEFKPVTGHLTLPQGYDMPAEESPVSASEPVETASADSYAISEAVIDQIVRRVIERMSSDTVRDIAWEVVPDMVERVVREVARDCASKKA